MKPNAPCPCGGKTYTSCCQVFHDGQIAPTPEKLMRSRYSAYVLQLEYYLRKTWDPSTLPDEPIFEEDKPTQWVELKIKNTRTAPDGLSGTVEFIAIFKVNGKAHRMHEISQFVKADGSWLYVDGEFPDIK